MTVLPITNPVPASRETVYSYLSRLAATWRTDVSSLAYDMGAPFKRFTEQDPAAFEALAGWAGLDPGQLNEMLSWTGIRAGNVRMEFRGEAFVTRALRNPVMRGCPVCLREDAAGHAGSEPAAMIMRGDWQMREAVICVRHRHPLIPLWRADRPRDRHDIGARLREILGDILSGALDRPETAPTSYDLWLDGRLRDGRDDTWFKGQPLYAATTFCRLLGQALLREDQTEVDGPHGDVHAAGFAVARHGEAVIREALDRLAASASGPLDAPAKAFGSLYSGLARDYSGEDGFDPYRRILRECVLDHWPIAPWDVLLGEVVAERRLHSLVSASKETGVGAQVIGHFLIEAGAIQEQDARPPSRRVFDARAHSGLLAEIPTLVGPIAMREAIGATRQELVALEEEGILVPRTHVSKVKNPWRIPDGVAFVARLRAGAVPVAEDDDGWETPLLARKRTDVGLADLIGAIREGRLAAGLRAGVSGLHGVVVQKREVDVLALEIEAAENSVGDDSSRLIGAAEFGRSVGLRDLGKFTALIEAGHTPATESRNPKTGRMQYFLSTDDVSSFHERFVTLTTLSIETGRHRNTLRKIVAPPRISRFAPDGRDFGSVYLRAEAVLLANALP